MSYYCPKHRYGIRTLKVCPRRVLEEMAELFPGCVGCDYGQTLEEFPTTPDKMIFTYSDPPDNWFNLEHYKEKLGKKVCEKARVRRYGLL